MMGKYANTPVIAHNTLFSITYEDVSYDVVDYNGIFCVIFKLDHIGQNNFILRHDGWCQLFASTPLDNLYHNIRLFDCVRTAQMFIELDIL